MSLKKSTSAPQPTSTTTPVVEEIPSKFPVIKFAAGELVRVLEPSGHLFAGKVLKIGDADSYFLHFQGWNQKWVRCSTEPFLVNPVRGSHGNPAADPDCCGARCRTSGYTRPC